MIFSLCSHFSHSHHCRVRVRVVPCVHGSLGETRSNLRIARGRRIIIDRATKNTFRSLWKYSRTLAQCRLWLWKTTSSGGTRHLSSKWQTLTERLITLATSNSKWPNRKSPKQHQITSDPTETTEYRCFFYNNRSELGRIENENGWDNAKLIHSQIVLVQSTLWSLSNGCIYLFGLVSYGIGAHLVYNGLLTGHQLYLYV